MMEQTHYTTVIDIPEIDEITVNDARRKHYSYRDKKVVLEGLFDDDKWILTDERSRFGFDFSIDEKSFLDFGKQLSITTKEFKDYLKTYIVCNMGDLSLITLQHIIYEIKRSIHLDTKELVSCIKSGELQWINRIMDFYAMLPASGREEALDKLLEDYDEAIDNAYFDSNTTNGGQRKLASFESYFRFDDILKKFWSESEDVDEKLFFFPVWFWWNVTGVVPVRPHEYILTPRNCLQTENDKSYLTICKNKTKGCGKKKEYRIKEDFPTVRYQIPERLAKEIRWYLEQTCNCRNTDIDTFLVTETHYHMWDRRAPYTSRYFTYVNLRTCLRYYYRFIVRERYGYNVLEDFEGSLLPNMKDIEYIQLGDTRHIALINLIAEGASPVAAMVLAGHDNPEMSAHYFSNIAQLIECRVYRQYKKMINGEQIYALSGAHSDLCVGESVPSAYGGFCYSRKMQNMDYSECYKVTGPAGEIGYCPNCNYYRDTNKGFHVSKDLYVNKIENEGILLHKIVKMVRAGRGDTEDIISVLNRINSASYSYQQYLMETGRIGDGKT